jgi:hypothetical protein
MEPSTTDDSSTVEASESVRKGPEIEPWLVSISVAAARVGVSPNTFRTHGLPITGSVRIGRRVLVPVRELKRYVAARRDRSAT